MTSIAAERGITHDELDLLMTGEVAQIFEIGQTTHRFAYLSPDPTVRETMANSTITYMSYMLYLHRNGTWERIDCIDPKFPQLEGLVNRMPKALLYTSLRVIPADGRLMAKTETALPADRRVWGLIAFGLTEDKEIATPAMFYPKGLTPEEAYRVFVRIEEMLQFCDNQGD